MLVFRHFSYTVFEVIQSELDRILRRKFAVEIYNLHPASFLKAIYLATRKSFHMRGRIGDMELTRLTPVEWARIWQSFRGGSVRVILGYSELFFHP